MVKKIQSLYFVLLMIMLFSSVVSGQDRPNLIIGGIWQTTKDQETNQVCANNLNAEYVHTYYTGWEYNPQDIAAVTDATPKITVFKDPSTGAIVIVPETASYKPTDLNGLTSDLLSQGPSNPSDHYDTIYAHSGGARTAVTALLYQHVTADALVLISPAMGPMDRELYLWEIQQLLDLGIVKEIIVYQSAVDTPWFNEQWLGKFNPGEIEGNFNMIDVSKEQLGGKTGNAAHKQLWYTSLNLELGRDPMSPAPKSLEDTKSAAADVLVEVKEQAGPQESASEKDIIGMWTLNYLTDKIYLHNMIIDTFNPNTGDFKGHGWYLDDLAYKWDLSGVVKGNNISFHITYTGRNPISWNPTFWVDAVGVISSATFMSGKANEPGQSATWNATRISS